MAFVLFVIIFLFDIIKPFTRFTSAKTGEASTIKISETVAKNVSGVVITSSPLPNPNANRILWSADVPELVATAYLVPIYSANCFSNSLTFSKLDYSYLPNSCLTKLRALPAS